MASVEAIVAVEVAVLPEAVAAVAAAEQLAAPGAERK